MITNNPGLGARIIETSVLWGIKSKSANTEVVGPLPAITQDGGWKIHPALAGITFYFWKSRDPKLKNFSYVTFKGNAPKAPWACYLTGWVSDSPEDSLTGFLREKAAQLAKEAGFIFDPEKHGYHWMQKVRRE